MAAQHTEHLDFLHKVVQGQDGSPEVYKQWADTYDEFLTTFHAGAPSSAVGIWKKYHPTIDQMNKHKIFDAGCGTGALGDEILKLLGRIDNIEIHGGDLSPDMLEKAKQKNIYTDLKVVNLKEELPYEPESFDSVLSSFVFTQGHCGPECVPNIIRILKKNCYFITTVRIEPYEQLKSEWKRQIKECSCKLVEEADIPYHDKAKGVALVIQKI